jgi:hypothetical protein
MGSILIDPTYHPIKYDIAYLDVSKLDNISLRYILDKIRRVSICMVDPSSGSGTI